jgi:PAS domain S-box-containing protein
LFGYDLRFFTHFPLLFAEYNESVQQTDGIHRKRDITGRLAEDLAASLQTEAALKRSEERLSLALQASSMGLWEWDVQTHELYWSDEQKKLFGLQPEQEITYDVYISMIHPDDRRMSEEIISRHLKTGGMYEFEHRTVWPDGSVHWILGKGRAYLENGRPVRMLGTSLDIDEQKRAEQESQRQKSFLEMLHKTAMEASLNLGKESRQMQSILHYATSICNTQHGQISILSAQPDSLAISEASGLFHDYLGQAIKYGEGVAGKVWQTGKPLIVSDYDTWQDRQTTFEKGLIKSVVGIPLRSGSDFYGVLVLASAADSDYFDVEQVNALVQLGDLASITLSNARLFEGLQESEQRFRSLADTAPVLVWIAGPDKGLTYFNKPWLDFTGRTMAEEAGDGWKHSVYPGDLDFCYHTYSDAFDRHEPYSAEYRIRRHDGVYRWILDKGVPRYSSTGEFQGFIGSCIDIEDMKRSNDLVLANAQLKNQQAQLLAINKTKDEFIALASHQLRTPATAVKQYISLLMHEFVGPLTDEQQKYLKIAYESNERQLLIIHDLLKTAQIDSSRYTLEKKVLDISRIIEEAAREVRTTCELKNQRVVLEDIESVKTEIDANEIKLVFVNLLENASKYSYPDTEIRVTMKKTAKRVEISVQDSGVGVSKADAKRIFDKFTRVDNELSDTVTGTGFGLYWVKRIVRMHGGSIRVDSEVGKGATFTMRLPLYA